MQSHRILNSFDLVEDEIEERFAEVQKRIFNSLEYNVEEYDLYTTVIKKEDFNIFESCFNPVIQEDMNDDSYSHIIKKINYNEKEINIKTFFLLNDYDFTEKDIDGYIENETDKYKVKFKLCKSEKYAKKIEKLYKLTENSKIEWKTVNIPYLYKFYDLILIDYPDDLIKTKDIKKIAYDIDNIEYKYNYILCWNIKEIEKAYDEYIEPINESITYRYHLQVDPNKKYLVGIEDKELIIGYKEQNSLQFVLNKKVNEEKVKLWEVMNGEIEYIKNFLDYGYYGNTVSNKINLERIYLIEDLKKMYQNINFIDDLKLKEIHLERPEDLEEVLKTDYNYFIREEFKIKNKKQKIYLEFEKSSSVYKFHLMNYIASIFELKVRDIEFIAVI